MDRTEVYSFYNTFKVTICLPPDVLSVSKTNIFSGTGTQITTHANKYKDSSVPLMYIYIFAGVCNLGK